MDISSIEPGADFVKEINKRVDQCEVLLAVIGPNWLGVSDNYGKRRLDNPNDFVRLEITRAMERDIRVIPLLIDDAPMPPAEAMPEPLQPLAGRNAITLGHTTNEQDLDRLCKFLETHLDLERASETEQTAPPQPVKTEIIHQPPQTGISKEDLIEIINDSGLDGRTIETMSDKYYERGKSVVQEALLAAALPLLEKSEGPDGDWTLSARHNLAFAVLNQGRAAEAAKLFSKLLDDRERVKGKDHSNTLATRQELTRAILDQGRAAKAEELLSKLLPDRERVLGKDHPRTLTTRRTLALAALEAGHLDAANVALAPLPEDGGDPDPLRMGQTALIRAMLADHEGDSKRASALLEQAETHLAHLLPEHYVRRQLSKYKDTRIPGKPGGTTLWMLDT